jgi:hypothetical protein
MKAFFCIHNSLASDPKHILYLSASKSMIMGIFEVLPKRKKKVSTQGSR